MKKPDKPHNGGQWTVARYKSFIKSALRQASMKWGPKNEALKEARLEKGWYRCAECGERVPATVKVVHPTDGTYKRVKNVHVDHIIPVIDPAVGFTTWDSVIERMFCEKEDLRVLCASCHKTITDEEKRIAKERRKGEKK